MGNEQKKEEKKEENPQALQTLEDKIVSSPNEETNNLQKPEEINQEQLNIEQKEEMKIEPEVKPNEKYPYDNIKGYKSPFDIEEITETKILPIPSDQQKEKEAQNINEHNPQVDNEKVKEVSYSADFNINADLNKEPSNALKTTDLEQYIKKDQELNQFQESMDKNQSNQNQVEEPYTDNNIEVKNIQTNLNIDSLKMDNQNEEQYTDNNLEVKNIDTYLHIDSLKVNQNEQQYTANNLDINNVNNQSNKDSLEINKNKENNIQEEQPYTFNKLDLNNINTNLKTDYSNINSDNKKNDIQLEQPYTFNNLNLNNIDSNINYNIENNVQNEVPYIDNNLEVNNIYTNLNIDSLNSGIKQENNIQNIPNAETDYTFDANIFKNSNYLAENDYSYDGDIFNNIDNNTNNNLNINEYNYDYNFENNNNNNLIQIESNDNQNIIGDNNYITNINPEENVQFSNMLVQQYLPSTIENLDTNIVKNTNTNINTNDINYQTNTDLNYDININKFSFGELLPRENVVNQENKELHFTESQDIYNENIPKVEEPKKEIVNDTIKLTKTEINNLLLEPNFISNKPPENGNEIINIDKKENKENLDANNNKLLVQLEESKTVYFNNLDNGTEQKPKEEEKNIGPISEVKEEIENNNININEKNQVNNSINNKNNEKNKEDIKIETDNKLNQENNLDISNQIKEIKEMPEKPFEQRDYIFNKKNIKVIKIEDEETRFCSDLLTPFFKKLFG